ncbi:vacuolar protein sorting-associated protein 45 [Serendipita sp. 397]|nr:vacuolar protein sorting-associated protein 45 [Serendipita sp. 397]KAG8802096.1 vacuolar protein sorting-associated protein 45 [Serendipita sp. 398]
MDVFKAVETYITKMVSSPSAVKVLLLDSHTTPVVSLTTTQSTLLSYQVYLIDRIDNRKRDRMAHMKCICFLRPTPETMDALAEELREPRYGEYYLYFSTILTKTAIERLAEADEYEVVREVQEFFADYAPLLPCLFSLNHVSTPTDSLYGSSPNTWNPAALERSVQGVLAVLLSLKKKPIIRYEKMSGMAKKLGGEILHRIQTEQTLFDFRLTQVPPVLLILDRRNDPVTPLLSQWTYQAMVHELLGIHNGRVDLSRVPDIRPELKDITLTLQTDPFFSHNHLATFGDLGMNLKTYVASYQSRSVSTASINSITDMKRFIEEYPEFQKLGGNAVQALVMNPSIQPFNKLRLVMLYALRYQKQAASNIATLISALQESGVSQEDAQLVYAVLNMAGADQRQDDLFSIENILAKGRSALKGLKGVENVYMQHRPHLSETLENLIKGRLKDTSYPFIENQKGVGPNSVLQKPQDVIVFMIGGTTYEEARIVSLINQELVGNGTGANPGTRILLGGTSVHNSSSYIAMIQSALANFPSSFTQPPTEIPAASSSGGAGPSLNVQLGGLNLSVGGIAGTGLYRSAGEGVSIQADGIRDGVKNLFGKVKQGVESIGLP